MTVEEVKERLKQNLESGKAEENFRLFGLTDEQVEGCLNMCRKSLEGYYGDDIFSTESNLTLKTFLEYEERINNDRK